MANEIQCDPGPGLTGATLYAQVRNAAGQIWNTVLAAFQTPSAGTVADYDIALTEQTGGWGYYVGNMPAVPAGVYTVTVKQQAGGSPAVADDVIGEDNLSWDGSALVAVGSLTATERAAIAAAWGVSVIGNGRTRDYFLQGGTNKVVDDLTGNIAVYNTDDATILVTIPRTRTAVDAITALDPP